MFFILSKTLNYLLMPLVIIIGLLLLSLIVRKQHYKARLIKISFLLLIFFSNDFIVNEVILLWEVPPTPYATIQKKYSYAILLTGVGKSDMTPTDRVYFGRGADRVTHTLQLFKLGIVKKILVSGGNGKLNKVEKQEADELAEVLMLMGVPPEAITIENISRNTHESAIQVTTLFKDQIKPEECILVTSAFHIRRSIACYQKQGWNIDSFSTDFISHPRRFTPDVLLIPQVEALYDWQILIREWTGMLVYKLMGYI